MDEIDEKLQRLLQLAYWINSTMEQRQFEPIEKKDIDEYESLKIDIDTIIKDNKTYAHLQQQNQYMIDDLHNQIKRLNEQKLKN